MNTNRWNPYLAGALAGLLLVLSVFVAGKYFGASTTFARSAAAVETAVGVDTSKIEYFTTKGGKYGAAGLPDWQLLFVLGIVVGSFAAARWSGTFQVVKVPEMWRRRFGGSPTKRALAAFAGGAIALVGVRLAGGCPSGHGLSGLSQLAVSGFLALTFFFVGGLITARILYGKTSGGAS